MAGKNDFNQEEYIEKVDSAHSKLKTLEGRIKHLETITDTALILKSIRKDNELRTELGNLIWQTIVHKAWQALLYILLAVILIPVLSKLFSFLMHLWFGVTI